MRYPTADQRAEWVGADGETTLTGPQAEHLEHLDRSVETLQVALPE